MPEEDEQYPMQLAVWVISEKKRAFIICMNICIFPCPFSKLKCFVVVPANNFSSLFWELCLLGFVLLSPYDCCLLFWK